MMVKEVAKFYQFLKNFPFVSFVFQFVWEVSDRPKCIVPIFTLQWIIVKHIGRTKMAQQGHSIRTFCCYISHKYRVFVSRFYPTTIWIVTYLISENCGNLFAIINSHYIQKRDFIINFLCCILFCIHSSIHIYFCATV